MPFPRTTAAVLSCLVLGACGAGADTDDRPSVVTSFYPLQFVAERVAGEHAEVESLTSPGGEAHDLELTPQQVASVQDADLVVYQKDFQAAVDDAVVQADREDGTTVDAASLVELLEETEGTEHDHEHAEEEGHDHAEEDGHEHDHGGVDPHLWLDPANMVAITEAVEQALAEVDPDHAAEFADNAEALTAELTALDEEFTTGLADCRVRDIVTSHAAFGYLVAAYDLHQVPIAGLDPSNEPSGGQLAEIANLVQEEGITTVFTERLVSPAVARTVAREAGVQTATLDPIEGLTSETSDEDYLSLMRTNLETLRKANDCS